MEIAVSSSKDMSLNFNIWHAQQYIKCCALLESIVQWDGLLTSTKYILFLFPRLAHEVHMFIFTQLEMGKIQPTQLHLHGHLLFHATFLFPVQKNSISNKQLPCFTPCVQWYKISYIKYVQLFWNTCLSSELTMLKVITFS